ncbi:hypothetical protein ACPA0O_22070 [Ectopseudomonas chengduensis]|nr:hypothetical protein [Pseudomonas sp. WS 5019]NMY16894.1 hypothetical protein [Pseudomonas sp. WS 5019]
MSSTKEYLFERQQEQCIEWIRQRYGIEIDPEADEEEWEELAREYWDMLAAEDAAVEAEYQWLNRHSHDEFFHEFFYELSKACSLLPLGNSLNTDTLNKLIYAHAVTLMEALISSVVRKLLISEPALLMNLVAGHKQLSVRTVTLKEIADEPKAVENIALDALSKMSFHNLQTIKSVLTAMFRVHMDGLDAGDIGSICSKRHDIIHRNGKTVDDESIDLTTQEVERAISAIREFVEDLNARIYKALTALNPNGF